MMQTRDTKNIFCSIHNEHQPRTPHVANEPQVSYQRVSNNIMCNSYHSWKLLGLKKKNTWPT